MKMGFYWSGSPASAFIKDMSCPGRWGGVILELYLLYRQRNGLPIHTVLFSIEHSCHQTGAPLFHGTVWEKVTSPPRSLFVQWKGFGPQESPTNQSQHTRFAEREPLALLMSHQALIILLQQCQTHPIGSFFQSSRCRIV